MSFCTDEVQLLDSSAAPGCAQVAVGARRTGLLSCQAARAAAVAFQSWPGQGPQALTERRCLKSFQPHQELEEVKLQPFPLCPGSL